ncbi:MAG: HNH endonuclease [Proteobacteria bacterium]|nr:HNH endonuclease [Pseudomonadota bacterium]
MKGIFDTRAGSGYDDEIVERYHFPNRYLAAARRSIGDWIIYREPQRGGGRAGYVATAFVIRIEPDPLRNDHSYAFVERFLPFDSIVPLRRGASFFEKQLDSVADRSKIGAALQGRSVRSITDDEFAAIVLDGLQSTLAPGNATKLGLETGTVGDDAADFLYAPPNEQRRRVVQMLLNRKLRDANFRRQVCEAYNDTCAVTGLRIINGGGKSEVQAAHIWAVKDGGPDVVQNGIALSSTVHWLFDRHLISLTDDYRLILSHNRVPESFRVLFVHHSGRIHLPGDQRCWPHPVYIAKHREAYSAA